VDGDNVTRWEVSDPSENVGAGTGSSACAPGTDPGGSVIHRLGLRNRLMNNRRPTEDARSVGAIDIGPSPGATASSMKASSRLGCSFATDFPKELPARFAHGSIRKRG